MGIQPVYDVIIVGSGAAGGIACHVLANKGLNVLCLEAGRMIDPATDFYTHKFPFEWTYRGKGKPGMYGDLPKGMEGKIKEWTDHLYSIPAEDPYALAEGAKFTWTRLRAVGGRTLLWGRGCDRFGPLDFKARSMQDGWGDDWPISYENIAPYYDKVENMIGVSGSAEDVFNTPHGKNLLPPFNARCGESIIKRSLEKRGMKVLRPSLAVLSRDYDGRPACHYCGACGHGCDTRSRYSSLEVVFPKLWGRKNFTLRPNAPVHTVVLDPATGKARGVTYIDADTRKECEVRGKVVVLAASMVESIRILLNSRNRDYPSGLANSSGTLGHYLMEHVTHGAVTGFLPELVGKPTTNDDGPSGAAYYIPRFVFGQKEKRKFLRGYQLFFSGGCTMGPGPGARLPGFGLGYKNRIKELYPAAVESRGYGEGLAFFSNYVEIDPGGLRDRYGIPQVRFHTTAEYHHAFAIMDEMYGQCEELLRAAGAEILPYEKGVPQPLGCVTHEAGGCRMGDDPKTSVLDKWNRCHDIKNLLVVDAGSFVSHPEKQITHTIFALAYRACDHLAEEFRLGNV